MNRISNNTAYLDFPVFQQHVSKPKSAAEHAPFVYLKAHKHCTMRILRGVSNIHLLNTVLFEFAIFETHVC